MSLLSLPERELRAALRDFIISKADVVLQNMRAGLVVISPIITLIGMDLHLSTIQLAWLTSIPVLCFTFASSATLNNSA